MNQCSPFIVIHLLHIQINHQIMGNQIDCNLVCQPSEFKDDSLLINPCNVRRVNLGLGSNMDSPKAVKPKLSFAKAVNDVLSLNKKVADIYAAHKEESLNDDYRGVKMSPYYVFHLFAYYDGEWLNGNLNGLGTLYYDNGALLEGIFKDALFIFPDGSFYKGSIKGEQANGHGVLKAKGMVYEGKWKNNKPHGRGEEISLTKKTVYRGEFRDGERHGNGRLVDEDGVVYDGVFLHNKFSHNACVAKSVAKSPIRRPVYLLKSPANPMPCLTPTNRCFPVKTHFRKLSSEMKSSHLKSSKLDCSLRIQRLNSECSKEPEPKSKAFHQRGRSDNKRPV